MNVTFSESELGIPAVLARLAHTIFDGLPDQDATMFPEAFLAAIPVGADLSLVAARFHRWLLADAQDGIARFCDAPLRQAIDRICELLTRQIAGDEPSSRAWDDAARRIDAIPPRYDVSDARHGGMNAALGVICAHDTRYVSELGTAADADARAADGAEAAYQAADAVANASYFGAAEAAEVDVTLDAWRAAREGYCGVMRDALLSLLSLAPVPANRSP